MATKKASNSSAAKKTPSKKTTGKSSSAKKATSAEKTAVRKSPAKTATKKTAAKKTSAAKKTAGKKLARRKYSPAAAEQVRQEMHEMHRGQLKIGKSNQKVTNPKQAIAIGLAEARRAGKKVPPNPNDPKKK